MKEALIKNNHCDFSRKVNEDNLMGYFLKRDLQYIYLNLNVLFNIHVKDNFSTADLK